MKVTALGGLEMEFRRVGESGLQVSVVGLGCNNFGRRLDMSGAERVVHAAIDAGITLFDTADVYGSGQSEEYLGSAVKGRRDRVLIATKFGMAMGDSVYDRGGSRLYIHRAVEASLRRLGTNYIDLLQMHAPDPSTCLDETLSTLDTLVRHGKVRYAGCSNFSGWQIADAAWTAQTTGCAPFVSAQNHYSLLNRDVERDVTPACRRFGLGLIPYFPLAAGVLTGKYRRGVQPAEGTRISRGGYETFTTDANFDIIERLEAFASERGVTLLQIAIGGLAAQPQVVSVIAGAMTPDQVQANVEACSWKPSSVDLARLDELTRR